MVPESRAGIEAMSGLPAERAVTGKVEWFDLYDFLREVVFRGVVRPALQAGERNAGLLRRCADFTETLFLNSTQSVSDAAYFQLVAPLYGSEELLTAAVPLMKPETLRITLGELDPDRLSAQTRGELADFLP
ncbi:MULTISPECIES: hypothetical protein [Streptomyces]|uniref:Uncharacterized protein n=1 Tax=Streptomyces lycii TaxID=2654337 RepID=A0ABQ7FFI7_9ACTN|nr:MULTISPECIES: hypothetical protein [Streptomyces]KAF4407667.1 hypothetical protein GCU69_18525 [Streptomyces lycii]PGH46818.1 hypothetical protein CRI70_31940 [Streptomyces sp. Ru87]